jgi:hypothetical protein
MLGRVSRAVHVDAPVKLAEVRTDCEGQEGKAEDDAYVAQGW